MGKEIEHKFLVKDDSFKKLSKGILYKQAYLSSKTGCTVRVRLVEDQGYITIKGKAVGITRPEYEYEIPFLDADEMIRNLCEKPFIEKYRYKFQYKGFTWEVDEFQRENKGLIVAEIELKFEDEVFSKPEWIGDEVTYDHRYSNSSLVKNPYKNWL